MLQPGTVIDARVLQLLADNMVRISIANLSIDVMSEVPLQAGQALQLAVSQTEAVSGSPWSGRALRRSHRQRHAGAGCAGRCRGQSPADIAPAKNTVLTPLEKVAVPVASRTAASKQDGLAPLFANLEAVAGAKALPPNLQQAVTQLLAQRTSLDPHLTGGEVKNAFQKSGLFLEASLASGPAAPAGGPRPQGGADRAAPDPAVIARRTAAAAGGCGGTAACPSSAPGSDGHDMLPQARLAASGDIPGLSGGSLCAWRPAPR